MANALLTPSIIAKEALMQLENNLVMGSVVHREYKKEFVKVGGTVTIRKPVKFYTADGATRVNQDVEEGDTSITIDQRKHVSWAFSTQDLTLTIDDYSERYIKPAAITLAQTMDARGYTLYKKLWNIVGTPGTVPGTYAQVSPVAQRLDEMAVPPHRYLGLNPAAHYAIAGDQTGLQQQDMVEDAYKNARIGRIAAMEAFSAQNVQSHTVGAHGGTPLINGAAQNTTYALTKSTNAQDLATDGWSASTTVLRAGDVITIDGVFAVNPVPGEGATGKTVLPYLQQFVVNSDVTSNGAGAATLNVSPAIITSGPYQTVSAAPADNAGITVFGTAGATYPQNMGFHRNAFALVTCPLEMPDGANWKARETHNGLSIRVVKDYDIGSDDEIIRMDVLYGWKAIYPELGCRLTG